MPSGQLIQIGITGISFLKSIEYLRPECPPITLAICAEPILLPQVGLVAWMSTSVIIKLSARTVCVFVYDIHLKDLQFLNGSPRFLVL